MRTCFNKCFYTIFFFLLLIPFCLEAKIDQVKSFASIEKELKQLDGNALVVFDVDEVLFTDQDAILRPIGDTLKFQIFNEKYAQAETSAEKDLTTSILSLPLIKAKKVLVEQKVPQIIKELQNQCVKVIALTSCPTRPFGIIKDFETWRLNHIAGFGINFEASFPSQKRFVFKNMVSRNVPPPVYNKGVIFAEGFSKADVLANFLIKMKLKPSKIIFVDDLYSNLQQMEVKFARQKIPFQGYYYVKVSEDSYGDLSEEVARFQFDYLFKHQKWLCDEEALKALQNEASPDSPKNSP